MNDEQSLIQRLRKRVARITRDELVLGIGDDCAIYRPSPKEELLFTTDFLLEDIHFRWSTHSAAEIGHKALARGLSDIAAMGGNPRFCLLSLGLPLRATSRWVDQFYAGLLKLAHATGTALAGGDLARTEKLTCDIVVCGSVPAGKALLRSGACPGDLLYVSGHLGGSALGLETGLGKAWKRHVAPQPRLALGKFLREKLQAHAAMDLSDGISLDLARLCQESGVSARLEHLPLFPGASEKQALHGGEDYELLFAVAPFTSVPGEVEGLPLTQIGTITAGRPGRVDWQGKKLAPAGFDHFRS